MLSTFNTVVGIGTIALVVVVVGLFALIFLGESQSKLFRFFKNNAFWIAALIAFGGTLGSLIYSEGFHLVPCTFCWWQRIFLYPQVVILAVGAWRKLRDMWIPSVILSVIGACFSTYHVLLQAGIVSSDGICSTAGTSCAQIDVLVFGWLTIPIMCLIMFASILAFSYFAHRKNA